MVVRCWASGQGRLGSLHSVTWSVREAWVPSWAGLDASPPGTSFPQLTAQVGVQGESVGGT